MAKDKILLKREELYELVWSTPMLQLAKRYGLSDRGLAKICAKLEIPLPGVGYWAKVAASKQVEKTPLKPLSTAGAAQYEIQAIDTAPSHPAPPVQTNLDNLHPLVLQTQQAFISIKIGPATDFLLNREQPHLDIRVRPETLERALRIMQAIVVELENGGHGITNERSHDGFKTLVSVDQDQVSIRLSERVGRHYSQDSNGNFLSPTFSSTGELELSIDNKFGIRKSWRDLKRQPLELALGQFIGTIKAIAEERKEAREQRVAYEKQQQKEKEEKEKRDKIVSDKRKFLIKIEMQVEHWQRAEAIREYLQAFEQAISNGRLEVKNADQFTAWISSARALADELDPMTGEWFDAPPVFTKDEPYYGSSHYEPPAYAPWWYVKHSKGWK